VIAPGVLYGKAAEDLHHLFKTAWLVDNAPLTVIGSGSNLVPTIHVTDLAQVVMSVMEAPPADQQYVVAVDQGRLSQRELVQAVSTG
jgi:adenylate kinase